MATSFNNFSIEQVSPSQPYSGQDYIHGTGTVGTLRPSGGEPEDEEYLQRLKRTQPAMTTNAGQTQNPGAQPQLQNPQVAASSPVTANGKMSDAPAYVAPQPAATTGTTTQTASGQTRNTAPPLQNATAGGGGAQPTSPDPFQAMGGGFWTGQQWVPRDHPLATASTPQGQQPGGAQPPAFNPYPGYAPAPGQPANSTYFADDLGNEEFMRYLGTQLGVDLPESYQAGDITQWGGFDEGPEGQQMRALLQQILANPHTMNDQAVAGLKSAQKETADALRTQGLQGASQAAAASGRYGSGTAAQDTSAVQSDFGSKVLDAYRGIDIQKLAQDRADELQALEVGDTLTQSRFGRESEGFANTLEGERLREQAGQAEAASGLDRSRLDFDVQNAQATDNRFVSTSGQEAQQLAMQRAIEQANINQAAARSGFDNWGLTSDNWNAEQDRNLNVYNQDADRGVQNRQIDVTEKLGTGGLELDRAKLGESGRQFDKGYNLDYLNFLLNKDKFADSSSMGWASLNSNNINNWLNGL